MILFLRTKNNDTIVDCEFLETKSEYDGKYYLDIRVAVDIIQYSALLLTKISQASEIVTDFDTIHNLRRWLHEVFYMARKAKDSDYQEVLKILRELFSITAKKYNLIFVED